LFNCLNRESVWQSWISLPRLPTGESSAHRNRRLPALAGTLQRLRSAQGDWCPLCAFRKGAGGLSPFIHSAAPSSNRADQFDFGSELGHVESDRLLVIGRTPALRPLTPSQVPQSGPAVSGICAIGTRSDVYFLSLACGKAWVRGQVGACSPHPPDSVQTRIALESTV
jgi:hypothetical protein